MAIFKTAQVAAGVLFLVAASTANAQIDWPMFGGDLAHDGYNPAETAISPATVAQLQPSWTASVAKTDTIFAQPVLASAVAGATTPNLLIVGSRRGQVYAFQADSTAAGGTIVWQTQLPNKATGCATATIYGAAAIDRTANNGAGAVYVGAAGYVYAYDLATGTIEPGWPSTGVAIPNLPNLTYGGTVYSGIVVWNGNVYVETAGSCEQGTWAGQITAISQTQAQVTGQWFTMSGTSAPPSISGGGIWGPGGVSIDPTPTTGAIYTATGNQYPIPPRGKGSALYGQAVVKLSPDLSQVLYANQPPNLGGDDDFGATPVLFSPPGCPSPMAAVGKKSGHFAIYTFQGAPQIIAFQGKVPAGVSMLGAAAWDPAANLLLVTNPFATGSPFPGGLVALALGANCQFTPAWTASQDLSGAPMLTQSTIMSPPTVANGVVYFGVGYNPKKGGNPSPTRVYAVADGTSGGVPPGTVLWQSSDIAGPVVTAPVVANGWLYAVSIDGKLHAYTLPGAPPRRAR